MSPVPTAMPWPNLQTLPLEELVAQMIVVRACGHLFDHQIRYPIWEPPAAKLQHWLQDLGIGGVILLGGSAAELAGRSHQLQSWAKYPLLLTADVEEGVGQRFSGATWFPPPLAIGAIAHQDLDKAQHYAHQMGAVTAQEAIAIGLNWIIAPTSDVNNNPANPVINVRAFGETPAIVSALVTAFIQGAQPYPVLTTAKHFPGHGDTAVDSHLDLPVLPHSLDRLHSIELPPFVAAIASGVESVMSAHLIIPALDTEHPATLSHPILTDLLRNQLGFSGLVVTDALVMAGVADHYSPEAVAVQAVEAGADVLMMPVDPEATIQAVVEAVKSGRIDKTRIQESVQRIWQVKQKVCNPSLLANSLSANIFPFQSLASPEAIATTQAILKDSGQTRGHIDPTEPGPKQTLILVDDSLNCPFLGLHTPAIAQLQAWGYTRQVLDCYTPNSFPSKLPSLSPHTRPPTLMQCFIRGNPWRGSAELMTLVGSWINALIAIERLQGVVIYGSPYALEQLQSVIPETIPYSFTYGQMPEAQAIALQTLFRISSR